MSNVEDQNFTLKIGGNLKFGKNTLGNYHIYFTLNKKMGKNLKRVKIPENI